MQIRGGENSKDAPDSRDPGRVNKPEQGDDPVGHACSNRGEHKVLDRLDASMFGGIRLSRDARRAVMQVPAANDRLWLIDLEQMNATRLSSGGGNATDGVLSPDGRFVLFPSDRAGGGYRFYRMPTDGSAPPSVLLEGTGRLHSISYPARMLGFTLNSTDAGREAYVVTVADDGAPTDKPILVAGGTNDQGSPTVSAAGTSVAYESSESGRPEITSRGSPILAAGAG